ncbi:MAG: hypothetical protein RI963_991 [Planctomycetota bacterium]|jgi:hypothetical protein
MPESDPPPEETLEDLIAQLRIPELVEVLEDLGIEANHEQAASIQKLVAQLGSVEAAIEAVQELGDSRDRRAA